MPILKAMIDLENDKRTLSARPPGYRSYVLRFWEERGEDATEVVWRFSLEDPVTDQRHGFADLAELIAWLQTEMHTS
jgi:hypothetical protein